MKRFTLTAFSSLLMLLFFTLGFTILKGPSSSISIRDAEMLYDIHPKTLSRDIMYPDKLSPQGRLIGFLMEGDLWVYDPTGMKEKKVAESDKLDWINSFEWQGNKSHVKINGISKGKKATVIIQLDGSDKPEMEIPQSFRTFSMGDNDVYAYNYWDEAENEGGLYLKTAEMDQPRLILPEIYPFSFAFSPDGNTLAFLYPETEDNLILTSYHIKDKKSETLAHHLDGSENSRIGFTSDGGHILLSLAGKDPAKLESKHEPYADRDMDIFAVETGTGNIFSVMSEESDDLLVGVDDDKVYWNISKPLVKSVLVSYPEGKITPLISQQSLLPSWHPKGKTIALVYGDWRLADSPLNWDLGVVEINKSGKVTGELSPLINGFHEDFGLSWSPDGRWIAYQSHRSKEPVMYYSSENSTDDIYLKPADGGKEIRLTDFCRDTWVPDWSPDGKSIVFCASDRNTGEGRMKPWILAIDDNGKVNQTQPLIADEIPGEVFSAMWSPDGEKLALEVSDRTENRSIWLVNRDGENAKHLISYKGLTLVSGLDFTPDGKEIIFSAYDGSHHQLFQIPVNGGEKKRITSGPYDIIFPQVSPDGQNIAATVFRNTKQLWVADIVIQ